MKEFSSISKLRKRYLRYRVTETLLFSIGLAVAIAGIISFFTNSIIVLILVPLTVGIVFFVLRFFYLKLSKTSNLRIAFYLNQQYPELKESSDLLVKPRSELSNLELLQTEKIENSISRIFPAVKFPHHLFLSSLVCLLGILSFVLITGFSNTNNVNSGVQEFVEDQNPVYTDSQTNVSLNEVLLQITPPTYTKLPILVANDLNGKTTENSKLEWKLSFSKPVEHVKIILSNGLELDCEKGIDGYSCKHMLTESIVYQIQWEYNGHVTVTDYYKMEMKKDEVPQVTIKDLPQFTRLKWGERKEIDVTTSLKDDYGIQHAEIVATVSKGSGESVKFREEHLRFTSPTKIEGLDIVAKRTLDFDKLGMEPGDELYFYVEAFDNKTPESQRNRTDTYFIALQDTASQSTSMEGGLGVDLMPEYFRSQRQIIIDSEKLLTEKKKINAQEFKSRSNELGYDQKVLRLRYGQFLGEEFETGIGPANATHEEEESHEDVVKSFGHEHDTENEHNVVEDKKGKVEEVHEHEHEDGEKDDPMAAYAHNHDNMEEATFFTQSIKAKLRAALTLMWDAELQLRLYDPKKSLPYQYQILKLLKEISQDSRVYVHRMGFDPPPLKEEKRLTADLTEIKNSTNRNDLIKSDLYPAIASAMQTLAEVLAQKSVVIDIELKEKLLKAGRELALLAIEQPGNYLQSLSLIKSTTEEKLNQREMRNALQKIQSVFWKVLPSQSSSPSKQSKSSHLLDVKFQEELNRQSND